MFDGVKLVTSSSCQSLSRQRRELVDCTGAATHGLRQRPQCRASDDRFFIAQQTDEVRNQSVQPRLVRQVSIECEQEFDRSEDG